MPTPDPLGARLEEIGLERGLAAVGFARAEVFESTRRDLEERKAAGLHATMQFTYRNPERSTDPSRALPGARSLVVGAAGYLRQPSEPAPGSEPKARVARYVWDDFYGKLRGALEAIASELTGAGFRARVLADDNALVDREAARRAGIGWYGKNANILLPGRGSWFLLGSVITDAELAPAEPLADGCGTCTRCLTSCPTDAIVAPGVVDARRCLAWLVQAEGVFPLAHREALGDRIYGCDDCQVVCPPNRVAASGASPIDALARGDQVSIHWLLEASDAELLAELGHWYIPRRDPRYLRRNALVALGNVGDPDDPATLAVLERWLASGDDLLAVHAVWACRRLGLARLVEAAGTELAGAEPAVDVEPRFPPGHP